MILLNLRVLEALPVTNDLAYLWLTGEASLPHVRNGR